MSSKVKFWVSNVLAVLFTALWYGSKFFPKLAPVQPFLAEAAVPLAASGLLAAYSPLVAPFLPDSLKTALGIVKGA